MGITERTTTLAKPAVEELQLRKPGVYVSLVINRRHKTARVVDFLAGSFIDKMKAINAAAIKEDVERVYMLVEREESQGWIKVGYAREGNLPAYYKRADAYMLGHLVSSKPKLNDEGIPVAPMADIAKAEKVLKQAAKLVDALDVPKGVRSEVVSDVVAGMQWGRPKRPAWLDDRFGRTGTRIHVAASKASGKGGEAIVSVELQENFGNAYVQPSVWPAKPEDVPMLLAGLMATSEELHRRSVTCTFGITPADNVHAASAMLAAGFRKTGILAKHFIVGTKRVDTILWTRGSDIEPT
jgi:TPR repeat protein